MTTERIAELKSKAARMDSDLEGFWMFECLKEIERLQADLARYAIEHPTICYTCGHEQPAATTDPDQLSGDSNQKPK